jgi:hypothetical protein
MLFCATEKIFESAFTHLRIKASTESQEAGAAVAV